MIYPKRSSSIFYFSDSNQQFSSKFHTTIIIHRMEYINRNYCIENMNKHATNESRNSIGTSLVQFFNSESSFSSEMNLTSNGFFQLKQDLILESQSIFETLKQCLVPRQELNNFENIEHVMHRTRILHSQTLPDFVKTLKKNGISDKNNEMYSGLDEHYKKLGALIHDYENLEKQSMTFDSFYNRYGSISNKNAQLQHKKQAAQTIILNIQGDSVRIQESPHHFQFKSVNSNYSGVPNNLKSSISASKLNGVSSKIKGEVKDLQQELISSKKRQKLLQEKHQSEVQMIKKYHHKRIKSLIHIFSEKQGQEKHSSFSQESKRKAAEQVAEINKKILQIMQKFDQEKLKNRQLINKQRQSNQIIQKLKNQLSFYRQKQETQNIENSKIIKSYGIENQMEKNGGKTKKVLSNLAYENTLLKKQLEKSHSFNLNKQKAQYIGLLQSNSILQKEIENLNRELSEKDNELDRIRIENIRLVNEKYRINKLLECAKHELIQTNKIASHLGASQKNDEKLIGSVITPVIKKYAIQNNNFNSFDEFSPIYQMLTKQYRVRLRRSCLKEKQLLFKNDVLEIGVITEFQKPNQLRSIVHFANSGNEAIKNFKLKVSNSNGNNIDLEKSQIQYLQAGEQKKISIKMLIKNYPLGSTVLSYSYQADNLQSSNKIQVPFNVFKMVEFGVRDGDFLNPLTKNIKLDRKIAKQFSGLSHYFDSQTSELVNHKQKVLAMTALHEHTDTKFLIDIKEVEKGFRNEGRQCTEYQIKYEHRFGDQQITTLIVNNIAFLLSKDQN